MNHNSPLADVQDQLPACYRCHSSKVRCRRAPGQVRCRRCTRAAYSDCHPRPSRRGHGRIGQQQQHVKKTRPKEPESAEPRHELHEQRGHDMDATDPSHPLLDLMTISITPSGGHDLADSVWTPLVSDFDPYSLPTLITTPTATPTQPSASSSDGVSPVFSESLPEDSVTVSSASSSSRNKSCDKRLSSASYMQALGDLNVQMLSQQPESMLDCIRQRHEEGPVEAALRLGLALRSLLGPYQTRQRDIPTVLFLLSTVLRLVSFLHDLLAQLQGMLLVDTTTNLNRKALLCALVFPPVRLGSLPLLLDDGIQNCDDRQLQVRPLQMHSIAMALSSAEALIDEVVQLTEASLADHMNDSDGDDDNDNHDDDGEGNGIKDEFALQALTRALVAKQEVVAETISALKDMLCC